MREEGNIVCLCDSDKIICLVYVNFGFHGRRKVKIGNVYLALKKKRKRFHKNKKGSWTLDKRKIEKQIFIIFVFYGYHTKFFLKLLTVY